MRGFYSLHRQRNKEKCKERKETKEPCPKDMGEDKKGIT